MTPNDYQNAAAATEAPFVGNSPTRIIKYTRALHGILGLETEVGELADLFKKKIFYNAFPGGIDIKAIEEEIGDILWYIALICNTYGLTIENTMEKNINKLRTRYPNGFSPEKTLNRNIKAEQEALNE